jgi:hypothetical protein
MLGTKTNEGPKRGFADAEIQGLFAGTAPMGLRGSADAELDFAALQQKCHEYFTMLNSTPASSAWGNSKG